MEMAMVIEVVAIQYTEEVVMASQCKKVAATSVWWCRW